MTDAQAARDGLAEGGCRISLAHVLQRKGALAEAERVLRAALAQGEPVPRGWFQAKLAEARLDQGDAAGARAIAREVSERGPRSSALGQIIARAVEAEALLALGERDAGRALLAESRAEIRALAARIEDTSLREAFLARGPWSARPLRLAEAEGLGAIPS